MASNSINKRRRTASDALHISDLPVGFIADVSAYLSMPSRALLAVAFNAQSSSSWNDYDLHRQSSISTAIVSAQQWDVLDFEDIEKDLAKQLTDDDVYATLTCINARDVLKRLILCGCTNIKGIGLNPLRGSTVLEQIDISLVGRYDNPYPAPESKISEEAVAPILVSIVSVDSCALKCIKFPTNWKREWEHPYPLRDFKRRYNELFSNRRDMICSKCNEDIQGIDDWMYGNRNRKICYDCLTLLCSNCRDGVNDAGFSLQLFCNTCDNTYCTDCVESTRCPNCEETKCKGCGNMEACDECGNAHCENCLNSCTGCNRTRCVDCMPYYRCEERGCFNGNCGDCYDGKEYDVKFCGECDSETCIGCKLKNVTENIRTGVECCSACALDAIPLLLQQKTKLVEEVEETAKLRKENEELKKKVENMSLS